MIFFLNKHLVYLYKIKGSILRDRIITHRYTNNHNRTFIQFYYLLLSVLEISIEKNMNYIIYDTVKIFLFFPRDFVWYFCSILHISSVCARTLHARLVTYHHKLDLAYNNALPDISVAKICVMFEIVWWTVNPSNSWPRKSAIPYETGIRRNA